MVETNPLVAAALTAVLLVARTTGSSLDRYNNKLPQCNQIDTQRALDLNEMMGVWYLVEIMYHSDKVPRGGETMNTCPYVVLSNGTRPSDGSQQYIDLVWKEDVGDIKYRFSVDPNNTPGMWFTQGMQTGSLITAGRPYAQYTGVVDVVKAVGSHMVLTFCSAPDSYSLVLSKQEKLSPAELRGVNSFLERKHLPNFGIRRTCGNSALVSAAWSSSALIVSALLIASFSLRT